MRRLIVTSIAALALAVPGLVSLGAGTAYADGIAPAPECSSFNSQIFCDSFAPVSPQTWTETITGPGFSYTSTFSAPDIRGACTPRVRYSESYSYVSGGVTYVSPVTSILCDPYPPE